MTESITGALVDQLKKASFYPEFVGGVWALEVPEPSSYPAACLLYPSTEFVWTTEETWIEKPQIVLLCYSSSAQLAESLARRSLKFLKDVSLTFFDDTTIQIFPTNFRGAASSRRDQNANRIFEFVVPMEIWFTRE